MAGELGFEPRLTESESAVLPLNYSPKALIRRRFFRSPKVLSLCLASGAWVPDAGSYLRHLARFSKVAGVPRHLA